MNLPPSGRQVTNLQRLLAHLHSPLRRLHSCLQCMGLGKFTNAILALQQLQELNSIISDWNQELTLSPTKSSWIHDRKFPSLASYRQNTPHIYTLSTPIIYNCIITHCLPFTHPVLISSLSSYCFCTITNCILGMLWTRHSSLRDLRHVP